MSILLASFGDWVVYDVGYKKETGRITEVREDTAFVCFSQGCTAAATPLKNMRLAHDDEIAVADKGIGFHRFDEFCPERTDAFCDVCRAKKEVE